MAGLKLALNDANDQCTLLFNEVQKAWKVSFTLQADMKVLYLIFLCIVVTFSLSNSCMVVANVFTNWLE